MTAAAEHLLRLEIPEVEQAYDARDVILYALGVGVGADPLSPAHLRYVYEEDLKALPSFAVVLGHPGFWPRDLPTGLDWRRIVHGEQTLSVHRPLPVTGAVRSRSRILGVSDKGDGKGAVIAYARDLFIDGLLTATIGQTLFCRGDGGMGSAGEAPPALAETPARAPDAEDRLATVRQAALIYRLSGDLNPLHADPEVAASAGFSQPILHGLATYGAATFSLLNALGEDPDRLRRIDCRFRNPVLPGDTLATQIWTAGSQVHFSVRAIERAVEVISHGYAEFGDVAA